MTADITSMQFKWDMHLIAWFHNHPDLRMTQCAHDFFVRYGQRPDGYDVETKERDLDVRLLRTPRDYQEATRVVTVYIATYLPKLSKVLWRTKPTDAFDVACKLGAYDNQAYRRHADHKELYKDAKKYRVASTEKSLAGLHWGRCAKQYMGVRKHGYK